MRRLLSVKNDFVFKKLFGEPGSEEILKPLLEAILKISINEIEISMDRELVKEREDDKTGIIDVRAKIDDQIIINIEIQIRNEYNIGKRSFFYLSKLYTEGLQKGNDYSSLLKTIAVNILNYNEFDKNYCHSVFRLKDENNDAEYFSDIMEIHFLELSKIQIDQKEEEALLDWLEFIRADKDEVVEMLSDKNKNIEKAVEKLEELSSDDEIRKLADSRAKYLSDFTSNMNASFKKGIEQGIEKGKLDLNVSHIKNLLKKGYDIELIADLLELSIAEVENIINEHIEPKG